MASYTSRPLIVKLQIAIRVIEKSIPELAANPKLSNAEYLRQKAIALNLLVSCKKRLKEELYRELGEPSAF